MIIKYTLIQGWTGSEGPSAKGLLNFAKIAHFGGPLGALFRSMHLIMSIGYSHNNKMHPNSGLDNSLLSSVSSSLYKFY